jgi:pimeloyl-ACP methyl ester carboxylesterase
MAKSEGTGRSSGFARLLLSLFVVVVLVIGGAYYLLYSATHPRRDGTRIDPADLMLHAEEITLHASDGVLLSGWLVKGAPRAPVIIMCHDLGGSGSALLGSGVSLNRAGYSLLLFDFRGHGLSGGSGGYLGVDERKDILGAIDFLKTRKDFDSTRIGLWGIGMGAYAGALAALDSPEVVALALDSLYPAVSAQMDRLVRARFPTPLHFVMPALHAIYRPYVALRPTDKTMLSTNLGGLAGRNVLLIAATDPPDRYQEEKEIYAALPEGPKGGKNLLELKASVVTGLYAEDRKTYDQAIVRFFTASLPRAGETRTPEGKKLQVLER